MIKNIVKNKMKENHGCVAGNQSNFTLEAKKMTKDDALL